MSSNPKGGGDQGPAVDPIVSAARQTQSYADRARMNVRFDQRLKRNVLDIEVEKTEVRDELFLSQEVIAKLLKSIGMNIEDHVEGYQVSYGGKSAKISVLCKNGVELERFCRQECFEVCKGVVTKNIRPSGRRDITVTVSGLDFNTPDSLVQDYISKFGGVLISKNVIYARHGEGPFKGKVNGDRRYQVDFSNATTTMGTYHYLDGERVRAYYRGNTKTCGRCHQGPGQCLGGGIARECQAEGGQRKDLIEHMKELWQQIGFSPTSFKIPETAENEEDDRQNLGGDQTILNTNTFPRKNAQPSLTTPEKEKFSKVKITNFPLVLTEHEALVFVNEKVDTSIKPGDIEIQRDERSSKIILGPGPDFSVIQKAIEILDFNTTQKFFYPDRKLHAKLYKPLSPVKNPGHPEATTHTNHPQEIIQFDQVKETEKNKVKAVVNGLENKGSKTTTSQAKLSSASTTQVVKHKQGLTFGAGDRSSKK